MDVVDVEVIEIEAVEIDGKVIEVLTIAEAPEGKEMATMQVDENAIADVALRMDDPRWQMAVLRELTRGVGHVIYPGTPTWQKQEAVRASMEHLAKNDDLRSAIAGMLDGNLPMYAAVLAYDLGYSDLKPANYAIFSPSVDDANWAQTEYARTAREIDWASSKKFLRDLIWQLSEEFRGTAIAMTFPPDEGEVIDVTEIKEAARLADESIGHAAIIDGRHWDGSPYAGYVIPEGPDYSYEGDAPIDISREIIGYRDGGDGPPIPIYGDPFYEIPETSGPDDGPEYTGDPIDSEAKEGGAPVFTGGSGGGDGGSGPVMDYAPELGAGYEDPAKRKTDYGKILGVASALVATVVGLQILFGGTKKE